MRVADLLPFSRALTSKPRESRRQSMIAVWWGTNETRASLRGDCARFTIA